ncbi:MAG: hypothetical protein NZM09_11720 [Ignavibacterium sp.]|nr:hypothetical protein [Ignavibacterium sp.]MDW8376343.1 hypothetical protein [Ignavibacteriales bacterium]
MKLRYKVILFGILFLIKSNSFAQVLSNYFVAVDSFKINFENKYYLSQTNILPNSEVVRLKDRILSKEAYKVDYTNGYFSIVDTVAYSIFDTVVISYLSLNLGLRKEYKLRTLIIQNDKDQQDIKAIIQPESKPLTAESIFGSGLQKSGTLVRGFTVGTNKDFTLKSGLRLQLSGNISEDIELVAALTDENTPIQPEGNTERLEELDKVFIQVKHPNATGTFGDYQLQQRFGEFGVVDRKLQGLMGEFKYGNSFGYLSFASSRGKFNTNKFNGIDGVQGPYRLSGINNERDIIIIAGTEKVFLDGVELKRGENNDYTIEYSNATITFTPKRIITSASRISVDFEYTDRQFSRNFFGTGAGSKFFNDKLKIGFQFLREGDDQNSPIDIILSEQDKEILKNAGDDRNKAVKSGVSIAEPDSLGIIRGLYFAKDTIISGTQFTYYVYSPGDSNAVYNVSFSYVGEGRGDYIRESIGQYKFVGKNAGSYLPITFLPIPQLKQLSTFNLQAEPFEKISFDIDLAMSSWDRNRFSSLDENDNNGYAINFLFKLNQQDLKINNLNFGKGSFFLRKRLIDRKFVSFDRFNEVEFDRYYNTSIQTSQTNENLTEVGANYFPIENLQLNSNFGFLRKGNEFISDRFNNLIRYQFQDKYGFDYNLDYVKSSNQSISNKWYRHKGNAFYKIGYFKPGIEFQAEDKADYFTRSDSLLQGSLKFIEITPFVELLNISGLRFQTKNSFRKDYLPLNGKLVEESNSQLYSFDLVYSELKEITTSLNFGYREKSYSNNFKRLGFLDNQSIVVRSQSRFDFWERLVDGDLFYEVSTQKSARLQKVFVRVERGTGNYKYLGDLNNNGIADEFEFEPTVFDGDFIVVTVPTDQLFPVIDLKFSTRWKFDLSQLSNGNSLIDEVLSALSTETLWRIEENSKDTKYSNVYLLRLSTFQKEATTIRGSNLFQQDIYIFENQQDLSFRLRFTERKSLNEFNAGFERGYYQEKSLRIKFRMIQEVSNQTDFSTTTDNLSTTTFSNRARRVNSNFITSDFSYRPSRIMEIGFKFRTGRSEDTFPQNKTIVDINSQALRFNLSFLGNGRLRIEVERNELTANTTINQIPFEITGGNLLGKNFLWRVNFDYRLSTNLQTTLSYDGRSQGNSRTIHSARAEARAFF